MFILKYILLILASCADYIMEMLGKHPIIGGVGAGGSLTIGLGIRYVLITDHTVMVFQVWAFGVTIFLGLLTTLAWFKKHTTLFDKSKFFKKNSKD